MLWALHCTCKKTNNLNFLFSPLECREKMDEILEQIPVELNKVGCYMVL